MRMQGVCGAASGGKRRETMSALSQDVRYGLRMLGKHPGFTALAVITLALGIGANTAIFSVFKSVLLEPFPYPQADRLVHIWQAQLGQRERNALTAPDFLDLRDRNRSFEEMNPVDALRSE